MRFEERYVINNDATFMVEISINPNKDDKNVTEITLWWESDKDPACTYVPHDIITVGYGIAVEAETLRVIGYDIPSVMGEINRMIRTHLNGYIERSNIRCISQHSVYFETISKHLTAILKHIPY